jgi:predicted enzyme related to lactoylglutathione lyase
MVTRDTPWPAGTPCWTDLMTTDADAARRFYGELFGWEIAVGGEETGYYGMASIDGKNIAGVGGMMGDNQPPAWTTYLASTDADATAAAITAAGGKLLQEPFDSWSSGGC